MRRFVLFVIFWGCWLLSLMFGCSDVAVEIVLYCNCKAFDDDGLRLLSRVSRHPSSLRFFFAKASVRHWAACPWGIEVAATS